MYKKILVPLDISGTDNVILDHVILLAGYHQAEVIFVHVSDGFAARFQNQLNLVDSEEVCRDRRRLDSVVERFRVSGIQAHAHLLTGEPVEGILSLLEEEQCDLVAMATHGHRFFLDWILGSVADNLRHRTGVPVLMLCSIRDKKGFKRSRGKEK